MTATPSVHFTAAGSLIDGGSQADLLGTEQVFDLSFANIGDQTGYTPYIDLTLPIGPDGITAFGGATYLGTPLITSVTETSATAETVRLALPFGSFQAGQTPADIAVTLTLPSNTAAANTPLMLAATSGFLNGNSATGSAAIMQAAPVNYSVTPSVLQISKQYLGPEQETAAGSAGANAVGAAWQVTGTLGDGVTFASLNLDDPLPNGTLPTSVAVADGTGNIWYYAIDPATGTLSFSPTDPRNPALVSSAATQPRVSYNVASNTVTAVFADIIGTGVASTSPSLTTSFNTSQFDQLGSGITTAAIATNDLVVADDLPAGSTLETFTLTGPSGEIWYYTYNPTTQVATLAGNSGAAPTAPQTMQVYTDTNPPPANVVASAGTAYVFIDQTNGVLTAHYGPASAGQVGVINATFLGGESQWKTGNASQSIAAGQTASNVDVTDVLPGGAVASSYTLDANGQSYVYDVSGSGASASISFDAAASSTPIGIGIGAGNANAGGQYVSFNAAANSFSAVLGTVSGGGAGVTDTIAAAFTGGLLQSASNPTNVALANTAGGSGSYVSSNSNSAVATGAVSLPPGPGNVPGSNTIDVKAIALQKSVSPEGAIVPGTTLDYTVRGEVSSYTDLNNLVVTDTLGDGQTYLAGQSIGLTVSNQGTTETVAVPTADVTVAAKDASGITTLSFDVSKAIIDDGINPAGTLDGTGAQSPLAAFALDYKSTIDASYSGSTEGYTDQRFLQGDSFSNTAGVTANVVGSGAQVSDGSKTSVSVPTGLVTKSIVDVNQATPTLNSNGLVSLPTGDDVTYQLQYVLPAGNADNVRLADFFPQPMLNVGETNGVSASGFTYVQGGLAAGDITLAPGSATGSQLTFTTDPATNQLVINLGSIADANDAPQTIDVLVTAKVTDSAFKDGLLKTNEVTAGETNSLGTVSQSSAIVNFDMSGPEVSVEKGVVATTDTHGAFSGSMGGVAWNGVGGGFTGTITGNSLASAPLNAALTNIGAGATSEIAIVAENTGSHAAFDVALTDSAIPAGLSFVAGSLNVTDGAGHALAFTDTGISAANPLGTIEISGTPLAAYDASSGGNIAVVTFDVVAQTAIATPNAVLPDTASIVNFATRSGGVNRVSTETAGQLNASTSITTAAPTVTKTFVSATDGDTASTLKIGEAGTYDITVTLPGGTSGNVSIGDALPSGMQFISSKVLSVGGNLDTSLAAGAISNTGTYGPGTVSDAVDTRGAADSITFQVVAETEGTASNLASSINTRLTDTGFAGETNPNTGGTATQRATLTSEVLSPKLSLSKLAEDLTTGGSYNTASTVHAGDEVQYRITLTNTGDDTAFNVQLSDLLGQIGTDSQGNPNISILPGSVTVNGGEATTLSAGSLTVANIGSLAVGASAVLIFDATVSANALYNAVITNNATASASTLPATDATGIAGTVTAAGKATLTIAKPSEAKALTGASDQLTLGNPQGIALPNLAVGESGIYTLTTNLPAGDSTDIKIVDTLPTGLTLDGTTLELIGGGITAANPNPVGVVSGNTVTYDLGAVHSTGTNDTVTIGVNATVADIAANQSGTSLTNTATVLSNGSLESTATARATVVQPNITLSKTPTILSGTGDAGTVVSYDVKFTNIGTAPAYNVNLTDTDLVPADLAIDPASFHESVAGTLSLAATGFTFTPNAALAVGQTVDVTYSAVYQNSVTPGETLTNEADVTYATQTTAGRALDTGIAVARESVALAPSINKTILSVSDTSVNGTAVPGAKAGNVQAGETVTFEIDVTPGHGTQLLNVRELFPMGLIFKGANLASTGGSTVGGFAATATATGEDFTLSNVIDPAGNNAPIVIDVTAQVASTATGTLTNTATAFSTAPYGTTGQSATVASQAAVTVVQPKLNVTKAVSFLSGQAGDTAATLQAGDVVQYTITIAQDAADANPAYNLALADLIQPGLSLNAGSLKVSGGEAASATARGPAVSVSATALKPGDVPITLTYTATAVDNVISGQTVPNSATLAYATEPSGGAALTATSNNVLVGVALSDTVSKTLVATSNGTQPEPNPMLGGPTIPGVIPNEELTFFVTGTLDYGAQNLTLTDALPAGLTYVSSEVAGIGTGITGSALAVGSQGSYANGVAGFAFGNIDVPANAAPNTITIAVTAMVNANDPVTTDPAHPVLITNLGTLVASNPTNSPFSGNGVTETTTAASTVEVMPPSEIKGMVFINTACDGLYQIGDATVAGVTVNLLNAAGQVVSTTQTDQNGDYQFNVAGGSTATYHEQYVLPAGLSFARQNADGGVPTADDSAVNPLTGQTAAFNVPAGQIVTSENAGVYLNGSFPGQTPAAVGSWQSVSFNDGGPVITGTGADNIHTNAGNNLILIGSSGSTDGNIVETGPGTDIVYSCGALNAQALGHGSVGPAAAGFSDYLFGGNGYNDLQGGAGSDYLMGGPGTNLIAGGSGPSALIAGINSQGAGQVSRDGSGGITGYTVNNEIRNGGGASTIVYQKGDGVLLLDTFQPGHDTLTLYGYPAGTTGIFTRSNGHTILDLGGNDAVVFNSFYNAAGTPGISFSNATAPLLVLHENAASGMPYFTAASPQNGLDGAGLRTLSSIVGVGQLTASTPFERLVASNGASFSLTGSTIGQDVFIGGTGAETIASFGNANTIDLASGAASNAVALAGTGNIVRLDSDGALGLSSLGSSILSGFTAGNTLDLSSLGAGIGVALKAGVSGDTLVQVTGGSFGSGFSTMADLVGVTPASLHVMGQSVLA